MANEQDVKTIPASDEATGATPDNSVSQSTPTDKGDMIPSYRLKEEADKRRSAENKLAEFEKADDERKALDLTYKERFDKLKDQFEGFKAATEQDKTVSEFSSKLMEAGLPGKIARVASKSTIDLSADNIDSKVKEAIKEFSEFMPSKDDKKPVTINPFSLKQPSGDTPAAKKSTNDPSAIWDEVRKQATKL